MIVFFLNLPLIQNYIRNIFEKDIEGQDTELYKTFFVPFDKESIKTKNVNNSPNSITESESPALEVIVVDKLLTDISADSELMGETSS